MILNKLQQLRADNHERHKVNQSLTQKLHAMGDDKVVIYLYDIIDADPYWGFTDVQMISLLNEAAGKDVELRINSPGGDVFVARAMVTAMQNYSGRIDVYIDALAASAATMVSAAGDSRTISAGAMYMIHCAWTIAAGNRHDMGGVIELLELADQSLVADYERVTGLDAAQLEEWMKSETWFSAEKAVEHGFVDQVAAVGASAAKASSGWKLSAYTNAPKVDHADVPAAVLGAPGNLVAKANLYSF